MPSVLVRMENVRIEQAYARVAEIRPIALGFHAKHPLIGLPAITDLAADEAAGPRVAALSEGYAKRVNEIPTIAALAPAAIGADVEAAPVVDHRKRGGWRCFDSHVCGGGGSAHPENKQTDRPQQKLLHRNFSIPVALSRPPS